MALYRFLFAPALLVTAVMTSSGPSDSPSAAPPREPGAAVAPVAPAPPAVPAALHAASHGPIRAR